MPASAFEVEMSTGCGIPPINVRRATRCPISPKQKVPIVLSFNDGVLALGGTKVDGIFRVLGDSDAVASLMMWPDCVSYTVGGVEDPHVPALTA